MVDYRKMYYRLFNAVTDMNRILEQAQIDCEEMHMESDLILLEPEDG